MLAFSRRVFVKRLLGVAVGMAVTATIGCAAEDDKEKDAPAAQPKKIRIVLVGDSTVATKSGWGEGFAAHLTDGAECFNKAASGRSSKSFRDEGHWEKALALRPDYVLIQFGHNDMPGKGPKRETDPKTTFPENLARYVDEARAQNATPILVTSLTRRTFGPDGKIRSSLTAYVEVTKKVAQEKVVPLIDLHAISIEHLNAMKPEDVALLEPKTPDGKRDYTHLNAKGGEVFGSIVIDELKVNVPELARVIKPRQ